MITLKTSFECETAHRLFDVNTFSEECRENIHGHSYRYVVEVARKKGNDVLNESNMICDFKLLKQVIKDFEKKYDHSVIIKENDPLCKSLLENCKKVNVVKENPTAEWMVKSFPEELNKLFDLKKLEIEVVSLEIAETTGNIAVWRK